MDFVDVLQEYKTVLGGVFIGVATIVGVVMNAAYTRRVERQAKREDNASFSSAIASELIDNADNLMDLYFQISCPQKTQKSLKITGYKQFNTLAYESLLEHIGKLGPTLSFMVVDVYGDVMKIKTRLNTLTDDEIYGCKDELQPDIQDVLVKAVTGSVMLYLYADYMSGRKWMDAIKPQRLLWIEKTLDMFFDYVGKTDTDLDFISQEDDHDVTFLKRFKDPDKRLYIKDFFKTINHTHDRLHHAEAWQAQILLRSLSYKLHNMLTMFLDHSPPEYYILSERSYDEIVKKMSR